jgi:hypothetical protein
MKVVSNTKLIQRNKKIGQILTISSLVILGGGLIASFTPAYITWSFGALLIGFLVSQFGIYYGSRWGRSPRPDEQITAKLKGLSDQYTLYHYITSVSHLLVGPAGIWVIMPYFQGGTITFDDKKGRWKQKGGNLYMKVFAQESLGRPDMDIKSSLNDAKISLDKIAPDINFPDPKAAVIFTNIKAVVQCENAPYPTLSGDKLKDFIRKQAKEQPASLEVIRQLQKTLPSEGEIVE